MIKKLIVFGLFFLQLLQVSAQNLKKLTIIIAEIPAIDLADLTVYLASDFNNWNPKSDVYQFKINKQSQLQLKISLPVSIVNFKITKGSWEKVECDFNGEEINNRSLKLNNDTTIYLKISAFADQFIRKIVESTRSKNVKIIDSAFYIPQLGLKRRIWVYLPSSYQNGKKKYPVLYMHDGQNLFDNATSGYGEWGVDETLDSISKSDDKQSIVIGIDHGGGDRLLEYNPFDSRFGKGKGGAYVDFIMKTLKPLIDRNYRTLNTPKNTGVIGSSMGGLISLYAALKYPKTFGVAGVFSPAFWVAPLIYDFAEKKKWNKKTRIFLLAGELESKEMIPDMRKMYELLINKGYPASNLKFVIQPDGQHSEWFWHREFVEFYKWL